MDGSEFISGDESERVVENACFFVPREFRRGGFLNPP